MIKIVNLTPHAIVAVNGDKKVTYPPSGMIARLIAKNIEIGEVDGMPLYRQSEMAPVTGIPDAEADTWYLVSMAVRAALPNRFDLISPGDLIRDEAGQPIGCKGFVCN